MGIREMGGGLSHAVIVGYDPYRDPSSNYR